MLNKKEESQSNETNVLLVVKILLQCDDSVLDRI